jgi:hypothetical protein
VSGFAAPAFIVSGAAGAGAGAGAGATAVVVVVDVESVLDALPLPLPQDAAKRPKERASTLSFTNFINMFFRWLRGFILFLQKGNPVFPINFWLLSWDIS